MVKFLFILGFVLSLLGFSGWASTFAYASHKGVGSSEGHYCATKYSTTWPTMQERVNYIHRQRRKYCHNKTTPSDIDKCARLVKPCLEWIADGCGGADICTEKVEPLVSTRSKASSEYLEKFDTRFASDSKQNPE